MFELYDIIVYTTDLCCYTTVSNLLAVELGE